MNDATPQIDQAEPSAAAVRGRKCWRTLEPYHGMIYFVPEAEEEYSAIGVEGRGFAQLMDNWAGVAETIQTKLDVALPRMSMGVVGEVEAFLRDGLRHHNQDPQKLLANPLISSWVRDTYEVFLRWVQTGEDKADFATLDRIRTTFEETAPSFARLVQASRDDARAAREAGEAGAP